MPAVPDVPGVPALSSFLTNPLTLLAADAVRVLIGSRAPEWAIVIDPRSAIGVAGAIIGAVQSLFSGNGFGDNAFSAIAPPLVIFDSMVTFSYKQDYSISDYPVEDGGFQSYDKVQHPADIRIRLAKGGSDFDRQVFLDLLDSVMNTTALYDIVTPDKIYLGYNFVHRDFDRAADHGVGLLLVDLWMTEVRVTSTSTFTNTISPANAGQQGIGLVQPTIGFKFPATGQVG